MKYILLFLLLSPIITFAQKTYIWCSETVNAVPRTEFLKGDTLDVVIFDGRNLENSKRDKCDNGELSKNIITAIVKTYPKSIINFLPADSYYNDPVSNHVTIKIGIAGYHAAFGSDIQIGIGSVGGDFSYGVFPKSEWNAITAYSVKVYDQRSGKDIKKTKNISRTESVSNMLGYKSAKKILEQTFRNANQDLFFFIDETLMK